MAFRCFKPYYNWNTFNTEERNGMESKRNGVLNLIITGIPSILRKEIRYRMRNCMF